MSDMRALIVDDERLARVALRGLLDEHGNVEIVAEADTVESAVRAIRSQDPDVVFLDIDMPDGLGFDVFESVDVRAKVVFVTAYDEHALRAFEVNALDYLVKPVDPAHIARALERVASTQAASPEVTESDDALSVDDMVCLQETNSMKFARVRNIVFIAAADDYTEVHLDSGKVVLVSQRLRRWEARLPDTFARAHRSTLVNLHHVDEISNVEGRWRVHVRGRTEPIAMSRRYAQMLKKRLALIA